MMRFLRSAFVIARRDFAATVLSKAFIFFLLGPLFPVLLGGVFAGIGSSVATRTERPVIAVIAPRADVERLAAARADLAAVVGDDSVVKLVGYSPEADLDAQQKGLLANRAPPVRAVLSGGLAHPHLTGAIGGDPATVGQLRLLIANALAPHASPAPDMPVPYVETPSS